MALSHDQNTPSHHKNMCAKYEIAQRKGVDNMAKKKDVLNSTMFLILRVM